MSRALFDHLLYYHHWPLRVSHTFCTWLWSPWNFKLQVGKLMHWRMIQALTCPLLHELQHCAKTLLPQLCVNTIRKVTFQRRYMKSCKQDKFQTGDYFLLNPYFPHTSYLLENWKVSSCQGKDLIWEENSWIYHWFAFAQTTANATSSAVLGFVHYLYQQLQLNKAAVSPVTKAKRSGQCK